MFCLCPFLREWDREERCTTAKFSYVKYVKNSYEVFDSNKFTKWPLNVFLIHLKLFLPRCWEFGVLFRKTALTIVRDHCASLRVCVSEHLHQNRAV